MNYIMTSIIPPTRKRSRSSEEEDFLPLSKKINNLHINKMNSEDAAVMWLPTGSEWPPHQVIPQLNDYPKLEDPHMKCPIVPTTQYPELYNQIPNEPCKIPGTSWQVPLTYSPDLGAHENPFYYENNKLLFELYLERLHRGVY